MPAHLRIGPEGLEERAGRPLREEAKAKDRNDFASNLKRSAPQAQRSSNGFCERSSNEVLLERSDRC